MIGIRLELSLNITGLEQPSGRLLLTMSMNERTSLAASSRSVPHSSSNETTDILSREEEVSSFRPSTEVRLFSMSLVTLVSISLAEAPG